MPRAQSKVLSVADSKAMKKSLQGDVAIHAAAKKAAEKEIKTSLGTRDAAIASAKKAHDAVVTSATKAHSAVEKTQSKLIAAADKQLAKAQSGLSELASTKEADAT